MLGRDTATGLVATDDDCATVGPRDFRRVKSVPEIPLTPNCCILTPSTWVLVVWAVVLKGAVAHIRKMGLLWMRMLMVLVDSCLETNAKMFWMSCELGLRAVKIAITQNIV